MYTVECDGVVIFDDTSILKDTILIENKLELADNSAGTYTFIMASSNRGYTVAKRMSSTITIKKDGTWIFSGRIIDDTYDFKNNRKCVCEGVLAFLNDTSVLNKDYSSTSISGFITNVLNEYNNHIGNNLNRNIYSGTITVQAVDGKGITDVIGNYENPLEFLKKQLVDFYKGHMRIRQTNGKFYLDYLTDYPKTAVQTIDFGTNLVDFTKNWKIDDVCSVCIPRGKQLDSEGSNRNKYLTCADANGGSPYIISNELVSIYGRIEKVVDFSDVSDPYILKTMGETYLSSIQYDKLVLTVSAIDLHMLNVSQPSFDMLDRIRCLSLPHTLDRYFPLTKMSIDLNSPQNAKYTLGDETSSSLSSVYSNSTSNTKNLLETIPSRESLIEEAFRNSNEILTAKTTGYVNITHQDDYSQALIISDAVPYNTASRYWQFNMNGLGYFVRQNDGTYKNQGIAITMDGQINADMITTGQMNADRILAGSITVTQIGNNAVTGKQIADGSITANKIVAGSITADKISASGISANLITSGTLRADVIEAGSITTTKIKDGAVTNSKIGSISADKITAGIISANITMTSPTIISKSGYKCVEISNGRIYIKSDNTIYGQIEQVNDGIYISTPKNSSLNFVLTRDEVALYGSGSSIGTDSSGSIKFYGPDIKVKRSGYGYRTGYNGYIGDCYFVMGICVGTS